MKGVLSVSNAGAVGDVPFAKGNGSDGILNSSLVLFAGNAAMVNLTSAEEDVSLILAVVLSAAIAGNVAVTLSSYRSWTMLKSDFSPAEEPSDSMETPFEAA